jgi:prepilin-type N-terminal cleavage/methylation domain-containing protein
MAERRGRAALSMRCGSVSIQRHRGSGFTMVELLVVMAIIAIMASVAIPVAIRWGATGSDELRMATRDLHSVLRAAQIHAAAYRVNAGVAYYIETMVDSIKEDMNPGSKPVEVVTAYAMIYSKPGKTENKYYFVPGSDGQFKPLPTGIVLFLNHPEGNIGPSLEIGGYDIGYKEDGSAEILGIIDLGMKKIDYLYTDTGENVVLDTGIRPDVGINSDSDQRFLLAHIFTPTGLLVAPFNDYKNRRERYVMQVGPSPTENWEVRLIDPFIDTQNPFFNFNIGDSNLIGSKIELYRSTGRVKVAP